MAQAKTQGPTEQEKALGEVSKYQWDDYVERFRPAEAALIKKARLTGGERAAAKGLASADTAAAFKGAARGSVAAGALTGAKVGSGRTKMSLAADATAAGAARGVAAAGATTNAELSSENQMLKIAGMGRGIAHNATMNMARDASRASQVSLAEAAARQQKKEAMINLAATVGGAAYRKHQSVKAANKQADLHRSRYEVPYDAAARLGMDPVSPPIPGLDSLLIDTSNNPLAQWTGG
jgi:hypothetical protein